MLSPEIRPRPPAWRHWLSATALLALAACAFALFTAANRYPYFYHPDEFGKAKQIVNKRRNFHHPLLLLNATQPLSRFWGKADAERKSESYQRATEAGRTVSAIFATVTVVALTAAAYLLSGFAGALGTALVLLFQPLLFEHAHIFKEDTALVAGLALTCLAAVLVWRQPLSLGRFAFLGAAAALAISGKYLGVCALAIALPVALLAPGAARGRRLGIFGAAFALTFILVNHQMFTHFGEWRESLSREVSFSVNGQRGLKADAPASYYLHWFALTVPFLAVVFLALNALHLATTARRRSVADWLIFAFPFAFTALLMLSPRTSDRYFLPAAVLFNFNALVGVGLSAEWFTRAFGRYRPAGQIAFALLALLLGWFGQFGQFQNAYAQFQIDDRRELESWMNEHLPANAQVAQDSTVGLPDPEHHKQKGLKREFQQRVVGSEFVADLGTLAELRAKGFRYVATSPKKSQRYTDGRMSPNAEGREDYDRRKAFYSALPQQAELLWKRDMREIDTLHPGLELYDLGAAQ